MNLRLSLGRGEEILEIAELIRWTHKGRNEDEVEHSVGKSNPTLDLTPLQYMNCDLFFSI